MKPLDKDIVSPANVANYIISFANETGESLTHLKLQKLLYYAQAWFLANEGKPLFNEDFQAWIHGPVLRSIYDEFKGAYPSTTIIKEINKEDILKIIGDEVGLFLEKVCETYMPFGGYQLEIMTHNELPWQEARGGLDSRSNSENIISKDTMMIFYHSLINA